MTQIKAIPTKYAGRRFRSRLEARWAVFFDSLGIRWQYELEGYRLPSGNYLPDFYLPDWGAWAEVKPTLASFNFGQARELAAGTKRDVLALVGEPAVSWFPMVRWLDPLAEIFGEPNAPIYDFIDLGRSVSKGRAWMLLRGPNDPYWQPSWWALQGVNAKWDRAVEHALGARFEFGEQGAPRA